MGFSSNAKKSVTWHTSVALHKCAMTHFFDKTSLWIIHITVCQGKQKFDIIVFLCKNFLEKFFTPPYVPPYKERDVFACGCVVTGIWFTTRSARHPSSW